MNTIKLSWLNLNRTGQGYRVYRSDSTMDTSNLPEPHADIPLGTTEYEDVGIQYGETWHYIVSSIDADGNESYSQEYVILCRENVYGMVDDGSYVKMTYDFTQLWRQYVWKGDKYVSNIDSDINGRLAAHNYRSNKILVLDTTGVVLKNESTGAGNYSNDHGFVEFMSDGGLLYQRSAGYSSSFNPIIKYLPDLTVDYSTYLSNHNAHTSHEEFSWVVWTNKDRDQLMIRSMDSNNDILWSNSSISYVSHTSIDSVGYVYASSDTGEIHKFFPDPDNYSVNDPPIWEDTTTFSGSSIVRMQNDREGSLVVGSTDGKIVKYDTSGDIVWDITLSHTINDMKIEYLGHVLLCTNDGKIIRLDTSDGSVIDNVDLPYTLELLSIDPGKQHITRGSIIDFSDT